VATVALIAGAIASVAGFGIGSLLTPILTLWFPTGVAVAFVALPHALATFIRWLGLRRDVSWAVFRQFGIASAVGGLAGALFQNRLASPVLTGVLGALLLLAGIGELARWQPPLPRSAVGGWVGGILSGFFGGLVGNQGGIRSLRRASSLRPLAARDRGHGDRFGAPRGSRPRARLSGDAGAGSRAGHASTRACLRRRGGWDLDRRADSAKNPGRSVPPAARHPLDRARSLPVSRRPLAGV